MQVVHRYSLRKPSDPRDGLNAVLGLLDMLKENETAHEVHEVTVLEGLLVPSLNRLRTLHLGPH